MTGSVQPFLSKVSNPQSDIRPWQKPWKFCSNLSFKIPSLIQITSLIEGVDVSTGRDLTHLPVWLLFFFFERIIAFIMWGPHIVIEFFFFLTHLSVFFPHLLIWFLLKRYFFCEDFLKKGKKEKQLDLVKFNFQLGKQLDFPFYNSTNISRQNLWVFHLRQR